MTIKLSRGVHITALVAAAMVGTSPFLVHGLVLGDDRGAHLRYQHFFDRQIAGGDLYPRWMPGMNSGRGSPIFFVQYPLPYYVAWGLGHLVPNHGFGSAYLAGFRRILELSDAAAILMMDADLSHDPAHIPAMLKKVETCDAVIGSRYVASGAVDGWEL